MFDPGAAAATDTHLGAIAAALGTIATALVFIVRFIQARVKGVRRKAIDAKERKSRGVGIAANRRVRQVKVLKGLASELGAQRALLIKCHNGGKVPNGGTPLFLTVLADTHAQSVAPIAGEYQQRPLVDPSYLELLSRLDAAEMILQPTEDLPVASMLRDEYEREGLLSAWICVVHRSDSTGSLFYLSASSKRVMHSDAASRAAVRAAAARLAPLVSLTVTQVGEEDDAPLEAPIISSADSSTGDSSDLAILP